MSDIFTNSFNTQSSHERQLTTPDANQGNMVINSRPLELYGPITKLISQGIGSVFYLSHTTNGVLSGSTTLGTEGLLSSALSAVVPPINGLFYDYRDWLDSTNYIDASTTTATTSGQSVLFGAGETLRSSTIFDNNETITKATFLTAGTLTGSGTPSYYLSADGGSNWESVTLGTQHTFTNTGQQLMFRIDVASATGTININVSGVETPFKVTTPT